MLNIVTKGLDDKTDGVDVKNRTISGWVSRIETDRDGEIVLPTAFEKNLDVYLRNGVLLLFHQHRSMPVGKVIEAKIYPSEGVWAKFYITKNPIGDEILTLAEEKILNGFSAGFVPIIAEENPPIQKLPPGSLQTAMGKKIKKLYQEVEWVETSLLPIPSNRLALIDRAEKGNSVADIIVKCFDLNKTQEMDSVIDKWIESQKSKALWDESEHPRDKNGMFTVGSYSHPVVDPIRESNYYGSTTGPSLSNNRAANEINRNVQESNRKLSEISDKQDRMVAGINRVSNHTSWSNWFMKYGLVAAGAIGFYLMVTRNKKISIKGFDDSDQKAISVLNIIAKFLKKGEELGLTGTEEYRKAKKFYDEAMAAFNSPKEFKGLSSLFIQQKGLSYLMIKEMSSEEFDESEHPRHPDGKFRKKADVSGSPKVKAKETNESLDHDDHIPVAAKNPKDKHYLRTWAKENKGKLFIAAGVASFPLIFATSKFGGRLFKACYSDAQKRTVPWDKLSVAERVKWREQVKPGDIFLQGGKAYDGLGEFVGDLMNMKSSGDAANRVNETLIKAVNGSHYGHSAMVVGHYDLALHQRALDELMNKSFRKRSNIVGSILPTLETNSGEKLIEYTMMKGVDVPSIKAIKGVGTIDEIKDALKFVGKESNESRIKSISQLNYKINRLTASIRSLSKNSPRSSNIPKLTLELNEAKKSLKNYSIVKNYENFYNGKGKVSETFGQFLIAAATNKPDKNGKSLILLYVTDHPMGGADTTGAILRPNINTYTKENMSKKIIEAAYKGERHDIVYSMGLQKDFSFSRIDTLLKKIGDPISAKMAETFVKDNRVLCSGAIAKFYKIFGGVPINQDVKYMFPHDIVADRNFGGMVLEAGKDNWVPAKEILKNERGDKAATAVIAGSGATAGGILAAAHHDDVKEAYENTKAKVEGKLHKGLSSLLIIKEMGSEEFKEEEHPRNKDGKFRKKTEAAKASVVEHAKAIKEDAEKFYNENEAASKVIIGSVVAVAGYKVAKESSLWLRKHNVKQVRKTMEEIVAACPNPHPNKKAIEDIANINVTNEIYDHHKLSSKAKEMVDYINGDSFQKDLSAEFGHLSAGGTRKFVVTNRAEIEFFSPFKTIAKSNLCYYMPNDTIYINVAFLQEIESKLAEHGLADAKKIVMHEYAHSITMAHNEIAIRHKDEYINFAKSLIGKEIRLAHIPGVFTIKDIIPKTSSMEKDLGLLRHLWFEDRTKNATGHYFDFVLENKSGGISYFESDSIPVVGVPSIGRVKRKSSEGRSFGDLLSDTFKTPEYEVDERTAYGLSHLSEWCSVKVEKGGRL